MAKIVVALKLLYSSLLGGAVARYEAKHELLSGLAGFLGFRLYNKNLRWLHDQEYLTVWGRFSESNHKIHERRFTLYNLAKIVRSLPGDSVECGVYHGAGSFLILSALEGDGVHHIFDSFEGLSQPESEDVPAASRTQAWAMNDLSVAEEVVLRNLNVYARRVKLYKGWIPERFADVEKCRFRFVHIDVDLYQPTKDALEFFYQRMVRGGVIVCDDFGFDTCPGAYKAFVEFLADKQESVIHLTTGTGFVVKV